MAVVDSILERGTAADVWELLTALRQDPHGRAAAAALAAASGSTVYGYPALIRACVEKWRRDRA